MPERTGVGRGPLVAGASLLAVLLVAGGVYTASASAGTGTAPDYRTAVVSRGPVDQVLTLTGTAERVDQVTATFPANGTVTRVAVTVGDHVSSGQTLATVDPTALRAAILAAEAMLAQDRASLIADQTTTTTASTAAGAAGATAPRAAPPRPAGPAQAPRPARVAAEQAARRARRARRRDGTTGTPAPLTPADRVRRRVVAPPPVGPVDPPSPLSARARWSARSRRRSRPCWQRSGPAPGARHGSVPRRRSHATADGDAQPDWCAVEAGLVGSREPRGIRPGDHPGTDAQ